MNNSNEFFTKICCPRSIHGVLLLTQIPSSARTEFFKTTVTVKLADVLCNLQSMVWWRCFIQNPLSVYSLKWITFYAFIQFQYFFTAWTKKFWILAVSSVQEITILKCKNDCDCKIHWPWTETSMVKKTCLLP